MKNCGKLFSPEFTWLGTNSLVLFPPETSPSEYVHQPCGRSPNKNTSAGTRLPRTSSLGPPRLHVLSPPEEWSAVLQLLSTGLQPRTPEVPGTTHFSPNCLCSCLPLTESTMFLVFLKHFCDLEDEEWKTPWADSWSRPEQGSGTGQRSLQEAEPPPVRPWMEGQTNPQRKLLTVYSLFP